MHNLNVQILGPLSFISTLNELKLFLKFNPLSDNLHDNPSIILFHIDALEDKEQNNYIKSHSCIKICAGKKKRIIDNYDANLE